MQVSLRKKKTFYSKPAIIKNNPVFCEEFCINQHHFSSKCINTAGFTGFIYKPCNQLDNCPFGIILFIFLSITDSLVIGNPYIPKKFALDYITCSVVRSSYFFEFLEFFL